MPWSYSWSAPCCCTSECLVEATLPFAAAHAPVVSWSIDKDRTIDSWPKVCFVHVECFATKSAIICLKNGQLCSPWSAVRRCSDGYYLQHFPCSQAFDWKHGAHRYVTWHFRPSCPQSKIVRDNAATLSSSMLGSEQQPKDVDTIHCILLSAWGPHN